MKCGISLITRLCPLVYLQEWVNWHLAIGFDKIWIYDGNSVNETDISSLSSDNVTIIKWPGKHQQLNAYKDFVNKQKSLVYEKMDWIVNIDDDEFVMIEQNGVSIKDILEAHETDSLAINLLTFGSSGFEKRIGNSQIEQFTKRTNLFYPENKLIKMIAKLDKIDSPNEVFTYRVRSLTTNVKGEVCTHIQMSRPLDSIIWVNHYFTRSKEEFTTKIKRGRADFSDAPKRFLGQLDHIDKLATVEDLRAVVRKSLLTRAK
jgi:hypothetical protein